ncbi:DUF4817 domain-containing protein [Trichonephila clavipes]|nr:DUF4817 domain-containing protein [Trichonephila clavipes]
MSMYVCQRNKGAGLRSWSVAGLVRLRLRIRPHLKSAYFSDTENRQRPHYMIMRHVKDPLSACLAWVLSENRCLLEYFSPGRKLGVKLPAVTGIRLFGAVLKRDKLPGNFGLAIHKNDHQAKRRFVEWAQNEIAVVPDFHKRILFSDEVHFWLNGYVNKQNCHIWSEANPQVYVETPLHPEKLTVWCALWAGGILLQNDEGHNVTVNGDRYRAMITNFFIPELNNHDVQEPWFQQDGATCHTARATIDLLKDTFGDRLISRFGPVNWPPRSCDLTPLDYFLWSYVKSLVYADKPQTLDHLEDNIRRVIADIRPQMLEKVIENGHPGLHPSQPWQSYARNHI